MVCVASRLAATGWRPPAGGNRLAASSWAARADGFRLDLQHTCLKRSQTSASATTTKFTVVTDHRMKAAYASRPTMS
jgi:hypothetical protein